jgi:hypothetical protein
MSTETAAEIIRQSYILAHVIDPNDEVEGYQMSLGIMYFNQILEELGASPEYVPYYTKTIIPIINNVTIYQVTPVVAQFLEGNVVDSSGVVYPVGQATDAQYNLFNFTTPSNRPQMVYISKEQTFDTLGNLATNLVVYPNPNATYTVNLLLKYKLPPVSSVTLDQQLLFLPPHWIKPLRYMLANDLINQFSTKVNEKFYVDLQKSMEMLTSNNPQDMSIQTQNVFRTFYRFKPGYYSYVG